MTEENKEKQNYLQVTDFYDVVIGINSFRNLKKKEQGDYGWDILYSKDFDYSTKTKEELIKIGVVGHGNRGKSYILSKLTNFKIPSGFSIKTEGISIKYPDMKTKDGNGMVIIDSAGFETPLLESFDCKLENLSNMNAKETNTKINDLAKDRAILEVFIQKYVLEYSDIIIAVVGQLSYSEQQLLLRIKRENAKKKLFIVHNLLNLVTKQQVTDYINDVLKKSLTFEIDERTMTTLDENNKVDDTQSNQTYYHEEYLIPNNKNSYTIEHLIMAREGTEAGNYYNQSAIQFLSNNINTTSKLTKFPIKASIKNYLYSMSNDFFETSIPQPKKDKKGKIVEKGVIIDGEVTIDNVKKNKIYIDGFNKDLVLKSISIDSLGFSSFLGRIYQPNYCLYITDKIEKLPIRKTKSELKIDTDKHYYILVLMVEIPGELEDPKITPTVDAKTDFIFKLEGSRKINKKNNEKSPKGYDCYYSSIKDGLFSLCIKIKPDNIMLSSTEPKFQHYENGLLTYYYVGSKSEGESEELEFD